METVFFCAINYSFSSILLLPDKKDRPAIPVSSGTLKPRVLTFRYGSIRFVANWKRNLLLSSTGAVNRHW
jgi:hypothetical protein